MEHQAWVLRSFLAQLERQEAEHEEAPNGIAGEFVRLKSQSTKYRNDKTYPSKTAEKQENIKKNRYKDIVPFDHSRVKLTLTTSKNDTDYINASFIKGVSGSRAYIATQGPLPNTVLDFLRMLWEYNIKVVVMACREFEMGKKKCERYWPQKQEQPFVCEPFTVYCDSEESKGDYLTRTLRVTYRNVSGVPTLTVRKTLRCYRTLTQLHYVNWPDHGVPDSIPPILEMLHEMRSDQAHDDVPICIHCSAGCGRTGALCVIDYTWNLLKKQMITPDFNIYDLVQNMRTQRPSLVQTKEQYELVYRTIKLLFERHLHSMETRARRNEAAAVPSPITPDTGSEDSDLSEDLDLLPELQQLLEEERNALARYPAPSPSSSEDLTDVGAKDLRRKQQEKYRPQSLPVALNTAQDLQEGPRTSPNLVHISQRVPAAEGRLQDTGVTPSLHPLPVATICSMVEDPYFDTPMSSPSSEEAPADCAKDTEQWTVSPIFSTPSLCLNNQTLELISPASGAVEVHTDEEAPPPLPQRTPESYVLAVDAEHPDPCEKLMVIIPPNAAAEAVRELGGSPPSPVPPLPERTPESFELAIDQAPVEQKLEVKPLVNLNRIGMSSEWSGNTSPAAAASQNETKPWTRSKSLKVKMTFTAMAPAIYPDLASSTTSTLFPYCPPEDPQTALLPPQSCADEGRQTPPLPDRTPESFVLPTEQRAHMQPTEKTQPSPRVGLSSELDGTPQPKKFLDVVMCRSKSVRAKSSRQEPLTAAPQLTSPPVVSAVGGSAQAGQHDVNRRSSLNTETSGNKSDKSSEKGMSRTRSLKFFRHKQKPKFAPPPPPTQPGTPPLSYAASSSVFKFGFGNRFGKPKGPRSYPETWV